MRGEVWREEIKRINTDMTRPIAVISTLSIWMESIVWAICITTSSQE